MGEIVVVCHEIDLVGPTLIIKDALVCRDHEVGSQRFIRGELMQLITFCTEKIHQRI